MRFSCPAFFGTALLVAVTACGSHAPPQYDSPPVLANRDEIQAAMRAVGAGLEARVLLLIHVDTTGRVASIRVKKSSGSNELDDAAEWIGRQMRFEPAIDDGRAVAALVEIPVRFDVVRMAVRPARLRNAEEIEARIVRDFGDTRGTARFRVSIGPEGWVQETQDRSPYDDAAQRAARRLIDDLRFWPSYHGDSARASWVILVFEFAGPETRVYIDAPGA
jgi:TonB family protein